MKLTVDIQFNIPINDDKIPLSMVEEWMFLYIVTDSFKHSCMILRNNFFYHYENPRVDVN